MAKAFADWKPSNDDAKFGEYLDAKLRAVDYGFDCDTLWLLSTEIAAFIDLDATMVMMGLLAVTMFVVGGSSRIGCEFLNMKEPLIDYILIVANSGAQKSKCNELTIRIITKIIDLAIQLKQDKGGDVASLKELKSHWLFIADSKATLKTEITKKNGMYWFDDECCPRLQSLCKHGGLAYCLNLWNKFKDYKASNNSSSVEINNDKFMVWFSNIQTTYFMGLLRAGGVSGIAQRITAVFPSIKRVTSDDICTQSNKQAIETAATIISKILLPAVEPHGFLGTSDCSVLYKIEGDGHDIAAAGHVRMGSLYLFYKNKESDDGSDGIKHSDNGFFCFKNDVEILFPSLSTTAREELFQRIPNPMSFADFVEIMRGTLDQCAGRFVKNADASKKIMKNYNISVSDSWTPKPSPKDNSNAQNPSKPPINTPLNVLRATMINVRKVVKGEKGMDKAEVSEWKIRDVYKSCGLESHVQAVKLYIQKMCDAGIIELVADSANK
eukprot:170286_1